MSNTHKHKAQGLLGKNIRSTSLWNAYRDHENHTLWIKAFGINPYRKESSISRHLTRKKFRAQSKQTLIDAKHDPDNTTFPLDPRT